eukprot:TRINITY_DN7986_c0_g1_i1.p1 TRINITY_DN7986_c0_g1~~TRINITY_DN7986_c0_g1_i1.p1  ORF type:complete len:185 (-),score=15.82 TRINITY_DN7986_c0_g1_i1:404-958(-)
MHQELFSAMDNTLGDLLGTICLLYVQAMNLERDESLLILGHLVGNREVQPDTEKIKAICDDETTEGQERVALLYQETDTTDATFDKNLPGRYLGFERMYGIMLERYWWPDIWKDTKSFVDGCDVFLMKKSRAADGIKLDTGLGQRGFSWTSTTDCAVTFAYFLHTLQQGTLIFILTLGENRERY